MADIASFANDWKSAAQSAGDVLGIPYQYILAQWGLESGWGTAAGTASVVNLANNNPADLKTSTGAWASFPTQSAFVSSYVSAVKADFTYFQAPPVSGATIEQIFGSESAPYAGSESATTYADSIASAYSALTNATGWAVGTDAGAQTPSSFNKQIESLNQTNQQALKTSSSVGNAIVKALGLKGIVSGIETSLDNAAFIALGVVFAVVGILLLVGSDFLQSKVATVAKEAIVK